MNIIARNAPNTEIVFPVQLNSADLPYTRGLLKDSKSIHLVAEPKYLSLIWLMNRSSFIISDSNNIQEHAPSLGKPVLIPRITTERPEAVSAGTAKLVGTNPETIAGEALQLIMDRSALKQKARYFNPFGDGLAAPRIVTYLPIALEWDE